MSTWRMASPPRAAHEQRPRVEVLRSLALPVLSSSWGVENGDVVMVRAPRERVLRVRRSLGVALSTLGARTYCTLGDRNDRRTGVVHWHSFRVLERAGLAMRSVDAYVSITERGRRSLECHTDVRCSPEVTTTS